jgi:dihydrofolate synthase/folylpolyglutamate synthase
LTDPIDWLLSLERLGMKFGLENMTRLVAALGNPEQSFLSVHVAGTNGKGSVTAMLETALHRAGHRSARYTSPHLERLEERFVVEGASVDTGSLATAVTRVRNGVLDLQQANPEFSPTFFECATAAAFVLFQSQAVRIAVIETGLGGRLDATNVIEPAATAITSIDLDHQALLGGTLAAIAREKAGIIKPHVPLVVGPLAPEAEREILRTAVEKNAAVSNGRDVPGVRPALRGRHQRDNIRVMVGLADVLKARGIDVPEEALRYAIENVQWPARLELLSDGAHEFLLDAAHNPAGARALADHLREAGWTDAALVFGAMADKDAVGMLTELTPVTSAIVCTTATGARAARAEELARIARSLGVPSTVHVEPDPERALALARTLSRRIVIAGSIFLVGPLRGILR